jgi:hypothetical protein
MKFLTNCRRTFLAFYSISLLSFIAYTKDMDTSMAISSIVIALAGANAYEKRSHKEKDIRDNPNYNK